MSADPDDVPDVPKVPVTKFGDLYLLGKHRLLCGDATVSTDLKRLMAGAEADAILTDPPYNVDYEGGTKEKLSISNDAMSEDAYRAFLVSSLLNASASLRKGAAFYIFHADSHGFTVRGACADAALVVRQCLVWVKSALVMGRRDYQSKHEPCLYGWKDGAAHSWLNDRSQTTVLAFDKPTKNLSHPTMKPAALFEYLLSNSCRPGEAVLDPFVGSGTTVIAAEKLGCRAYAMELSPAYCDVVVERWQTFTGGVAMLEKP